MPAVAALEGLMEEVASAQAKLTYSREQGGASTQFKGCAAHRTGLPRMPSSPFLCLSSPEKGSPPLVLLGPGC